MLTSQTITRSARVALVRQPARTFGSFSRISNQLQPRQQQQQQQQRAQKQEDHGHQAQQLGQRQKSRHYGFYIDFGKPLIKVITLTFATYYGLIYLWELLESNEPEEIPNIQPVNKVQD